MTHVQHHLMVLRLRHATACFSKDPVVGQDECCALCSFYVAVSFFFILRLRLDGRTPFVLVTLDVSKFRVVLSLESKQQRFVSGNCSFADWMSFVCAHYHIVSFLLCLLPHSQEG